MRIMLAALVMLVLAAAPGAAGAVGFQRAAVPDSDGKPREVGMWYPSEAPASPQPLGPHRQTVAVDGPIAGRQLRLVVILHGVGGTFENHYHTALALAEAGFVVAGVTQGQDMRLVEQPRHVGRVLDYMLAAWPDHDRIDPAGIGILGFSVGGFAALAAIGGVPDLGRVTAHCAEHPDRVCRILKERNADLSVPAAAWVRDARIKAAVIAAPTLGFTFGPQALAAVKVPVQLWRAGSDDVTPHPWNAEAISNALPTRPDYVVVPNAGHFVFIACGPEGVQRAPNACRDAPDFDRQAFHQRFNTAVVGFFRTRLPAP